MPESLDEILRREPASAETPQEQPAQQETTQAPVAGTPPVPEADDEGVTVSQEGRKFVPQEALHAERQKAKRYTEQIAEYDRKLSEREQAWERRFSQLLERVAPPQQQGQQPQEPPDFFADPNAAVNQTLQTALQPFQQQFSQLSETISRRFAVQEHGQEGVQAAYQAIERGLQTDPNARVEYQRIMGSGDPWGELVRWHKKETALKEIGDDPDAYRAKIEAEILAKHGLNNGNQQGNGAQRPAPVMPSNLAAARNVGTRSGPAWGGPPEIAEIFNRKRTPG